MKMIISYGSVEKYKARLVAKGDSQVEDINFGEIVSTVAKLISIRFPISKARAFDLEIEQMNVKTFFLHGGLEEEIDYMTIIEHYVEKDRVIGLQIKKSLYGLEQ